jgi:N-acetylneuraminic acid mutarotase
MKNFYILAFLLFLLTQLALISCKKEFTRPYPEVSTLSVSDISPDGFLAHGLIENKGNQEVLEMGFSYSQNPLFNELYSSKVIADKPVKSGRFSLKVESALYPNELYYVRAYVKTKDHFVIGPSVEVRSLGGKAPEIIGFTPEIVVPGDTVEIRGRHFSYSGVGNLVKLNTIQAEVVNSTDTKIRFVVPTGVVNGEYDLFLTVAGTTVTANVKIRIGNLSIHSIEPLLATYSDTISISGENFGNNPFGIMVFFNERPSQVVFASPSLIKALVPVDLIYPTAKVKVTTNFGEAQHPVDFQLLRPEVISFLPDTLNSLLDTITIVGQNFTPYLPAIKIRVKGYNARLINATPTEIKFRINESIYYMHDPLISIRDTFHVSLQVSNQGEAEGASQRYLLMNYQSRFTRLNNFPGEAQAFSNSFSYDNKGYVILGFGSSNASRQFWEYDPESDAWSPKPSFPGAPRYWAFSFVIGNELFIGGGKDGNSYFSDFYKFNFVTNSWSQLADYPDPCTSMAVSFLLNNKAYVGTGYYFPNNVVYSNRFWSYNPFLNTWTQVLNFPRSTNAAVAFSHESNGYVYDRNQLFRFDGLNWFQEDSPALDMTKMLAVKNGDKVYVGLGEQYGPGSRDFYEFNLSTGQWINKPIPNSQRRYGSAGFAISGRIFIINGFGVYPEDFHGVWEYNPDKP